jgi:hypothetical protein
VCRERCSNVLEPIREQLRADLGRVGGFLTSQQSYGSTQRAARSWCLHPNDASLSGELGTTKGAGRREAAAAGKPYAQKQNGGPPQLTTTDCAASSKKSRLLVRNAQCIDGIVDYGLFFNVTSGRVKQFRCPQNQSQSASAGSCGSLTQSAGWSAKPLLKNAIGGRLLVRQHAPR